MSAPVEPMEALLAEQLPNGVGWQYEPKWDGFRCIAVRDSDRVELWSKSGKPLARHFPEIAALLAGLKAKRFTVDGELLIERGSILSFEALQARLHPAASRVIRLAAETPARFMAFDCVGLGGKSLFGTPLGERRVTLEKFIENEADPALMLSPATVDRALAGEWLDRSGVALDGVIAKRIGDTYRPGERAMIKVKVRRTADCVIGGFRYEQKGGGVASLLLGLYDEAGLLNHVGYTSSITANERAIWAALLKPAIAAPGFTGKAPGGPSRWGNERSSEWQPLRPELVVEVLYDQVTGQRFRHGTKLLRKRPDKAPRQCTMAQLSHPLRPSQIAQLLQPSKG